MISYLQPSSGLHFDFSFISTISLGRCKFLETWHQSLFSFLSNLWNGYFIDDIYDYQMKYSDLYQVKKRNLLKIKNAILTGETNPDLIPHMMMSWHENTFWITCHLWGESSNEWPADSSHKRPVMHFLKSCCINNRVTGVLIHHDSHVTSMCWVWLATRISLTHW